MRRWLVRLCLMPLLPLGIFIGHPLFALALAIDYHRNPIPIYLRSFTILFSALKTGHLPLEFN